MADRLVRDLSAISDASTDPEFLAVAERVLAAGVPWITRLHALGALVWRATPGLEGLGLYLAAPPGIRLALVAGQGGPGALEVPWSLGVAGAAAGDRAVQIVPRVGMLPGHGLVSWTAQSALAVPIIIHGGAMGVILLTATDPDRLGPFEAERILAVAGSVQAHCPPDWARGLPTGFGGEGPPTDGP
jgi:GAF domain-containing protein